MVWKVAIIAGVVVVVVAAIGVVALIPRSSGDGWRLDRSANWEPDPPGAGDLRPTVTVYGGDASSIGIGVTAFGSSSCPPELRGVEIEESGVAVSIGGPFMPFVGSCTADAAPHPFGIVVERATLPGLPFDVVVHHDDRSSTTEIDTLP